MIFLTIYRRKYDMNKKELRIHAIIKELTSNPSQSTSELAQKFNVSIMTIHRDLSYIKEHGMMEESSKAEDEYESKIEEIKNANLKKAIASYAVSLIEPNEVIVLDGGTTAGLIASLLPDDIPLTVICYSFHILSKLYNKKNINLIVSGGYFHRNSQIFESNQSASFLKQFRASRMFLCASGVHESLGITCADQRAASSKQASLSMSSSKILVCDSTKFNHTSAGYVSSLEDIDMVITDSRIPEDWIERFESINLTYKIVEV